MGNTSRVSDGSESPPHWNAGLCRDWPTHVCFTAGRGLKSHAYTHSVQFTHHVFLNLHTLKFYCLPDNYEIIDSSLEDITVSTSTSDDAFFTWTWIAFMIEHIFELKQTLQWKRLTVEWRNKIVLNGMLWMGIFVSLGMYTLYIWIQLKYCHCLVWKVTSQKGQTKMNLYKQSLHVNMQNRAGFGCLQVRVESKRDETHWPKCTGYQLFYFICIHMKIAVIKININLVWRNVWLVLPVNSD